MATKTGHAVVAIATLTLLLVLSCVRMAFWADGAASMAFMVPRADMVRLSHVTGAAGPEAMSPSASQSPPDAAALAHGAADGQKEAAGASGLRMLPLSACSVLAAVAMLAAGRRKRKARSVVLARPVEVLGFTSGAASAFAGVSSPAPAPPLAASASASPRAPPRAPRVRTRAVADPDVLAQLAAQMADPAQAAAVIAAVAQVAADIPKELLTLLGPPQPAGAFELGEQANSAWSAVANFFFDPRLQWDENGNILLDPKGEPLPDNLWTQFVACQATLIKRLNEGLSGLGIPQSFGFAVALYTLCIRVLLYPFVRGQLETTAKIQVLAPRVNEIREKYKDDEERLQQEVGLLYMDLQIDPLGAVAPLLLQLPVFWGLYRALRRLAIVQYEPLREGWLWIPSLYGPNFEPDPSFKWITSWQGPLIELHPKIGWTDFALYSVLPVTIAFAYREVLKDATSDENSPKILQVFPFLLAFITVELPQALGIYLATNIASSVALTAYTKNEISSQIPGYEEFVKTGKWPPGVDPEKVLAKAFGVKRLVNESGVSDDDPDTVPEAVFAGRADFIPELLRQGRSIDEFDDRGIPATAYTIALNNPELLKYLLELGAKPEIVDKRGNSLLHYAAGYGRTEFLNDLLEQDAAKRMNSTNEDGQTPLDVARMNLSQENVAEAVRKVVTLLTEKGAEGKATTQEDEARFEEAREQKKREKEANAARSALKALAMTAQAARDQEAAKAAEEAAAKAEAEGTPEAAQTHDAEPEQPSLLEQSLDRVKTLDVASLKERLGDKMSEEQLAKLSERLSQMSPEDLAAYMAGLPSVKKSSEEAAEKAEKAEAEKSKPAEDAESKRQSVMVD